jgi:hypothetical protein
MAPRSTSFTAGGTILDRPGIALYIRKERSIGQHRGGGCEGSSFGTGCARLQVEPN